MASEGEPLLQAVGLEVRRSGSRVLGPLDLELRSGDPVALLGPNAAGKSTLLAALAGVLPASGQLRLGSEALDARARRRRVGYLPERAPLYPEMSPWEHLVFCARLYGLRGAGARDAARQALGDCRLEAVARRPAGRLSLGQRKRLGIAMALVHRPPVLLLDEPTSGLDPRQVDSLLALLASLGRERAVLLSSHVLAEVRRSCQRLLVLVAGRLVHESRLHGVGGAAEVVVRLGGDVGREALDAVAGVTVRQALGAGRWLLALDDAAAGQRLLSAVLAGGWPLLEWLPPSLDLERRYLELTAGDCP